MADPRWTICPRCGSFEVHGDYLTPLGQIHECKECGYKGPFVIEADSMDDAKRIQREIRREGGPVEEGPGS